MMIKHNGTVCLISDRLVLRKFVLADAAAVFEGWSGKSHENEKIVRFLTWNPKSTVDEVKIMLQEWISEYQKTDAFYKWGICLKGNSEKVIGVIGVCNLEDEVGRAEISFCLSKEYWNQGIMTEALQQIIFFLFESEGYNRIEAECCVKNMGSRRILEKAGMRYEGILRKSAKLNAGICDMMWYSVLREEFNAKLLNQQEEV